MNILKEITEILSEILDIENNNNISPETYLIRELDIESIDFLELAVALNSRFKIDVDDDEIFLRKLKQYITEAEQQDKDIVQYLTEKFPFMMQKRLKEIIADIEDGPAIKVKDLISYVERQCDEN